MPAGALRARLLGLKREERGFETFSRLFPPHINQSINGEESGDFRLGGDDPIIHQCLVSLFDLCGSSPPLPFPLPLRN